MAKDTVLAGFHKRHGGRMVEFAGWNLPVMYTGILEEHAAVRNAAGLFDVSHMGEAYVKGPRSVEFLNAVLSNEYSDLKVGKSRYSLVFDENGECIDDVIASKFADDFFMIVLNASNTGTDVEFLKAHAPRFGVEVSDVSDSFALLALQGPLSAEVLKAAGYDVSALKRFSFERSGDMIISRTGYTGSDGFEIFCPPAAAEGLVEKILAADSRVKLCGLGARDSLRLEAGYPLYGHEISREVSPLEAGLGRFIKFEKDFTGRAALLEKGKSLRRAVRLFKVEGRRMVREGAEIFSGERPVGRALSACWSPALNCPIGSALIDADCLDAKDFHSTLRGDKINLELTDKFL